jgi:hypothetical protein
MRILDDVAAAQLGLMMCLLAFVVFGLCSAQFVKTQRDKMSSYIRYDRYLSLEDDEEKESENKVVAEMEDRTQKPTFAGEESALRGRLMDFRGKDYLSDFTLSAITGCACYSMLYMLYLWRAYTVMYWMIGINLALVMLPLLLLYLSLKHPGWVPSALSMHLRFEYHLVVHHKSTEGLSSFRGPFASFNALVLLGFGMGLSSLDMLRYLPWRLTRFCVASRGLPSWAAFKVLEGSHTILLACYAIVQLMMLLPESMNIGIYDEVSGHRVHMSLAIPTRESLSNYINGDINDTPDFLSTGALFGLLLVILLVVRIYRVFSHHKRLLTQGRTYKRACFESCTSVPAAIVGCGGGGGTTDANTTVRPLAAVADAAVDGFAPVGHYSPTGKYRYSEDDDVDFLDVSDKVALLSDTVMISPLSPGSDAAANKAAVGSSGGNEVDMIDEQLERARQKRLVKVAKMDKDERRERKERKEARSRLL